MWLDGVASKRRVTLRVLGLKRRRGVVGDDGDCRGLSDAEPNVGVVEVEMEDEACEGEHGGPATEGDREESEQHHRQQHTAPRRKHHLGPVA